MKQGVWTVSWIGLLILMTAGCCGLSEREVAKQLDRTLEITRQGSDLLAADTELSQFTIEIDGFKNAMRLKGEVATEPQRNRAEKLLWSVPGVQSVENLLWVGQKSR